MIQLHMVAHYGGFSYNDTRAVVHKEILSDCRDGMDVYSGGAVRVLAHNPRNQRYREKIQHLTDIFQPARHFLIIVKL